LRKEVTTSPPAAPAFNVGTIAVVAVGAVLIIGSLFFFAKRKEANAWDESTIVMLEN
jgi:LPXTG-motif cell wall-anchored protein